ncbi:MAG TPA: DUF2262 domain-containing protein [Steroidobacteraceae bacterium]|nr:DUF2262 domain-containing protein [Steroidobacteraceae bacterium]
MRRIVGVVTAMGPGGVRHGNDGWMIVFHLSPWRADDDVVQKSELRITKAMSEKDIEKMNKKIDGMAVITLTAHDFTPFHSGQSATLDEVLDFNHDDAEMRAAAAQLRVPVKVHHHTLGELKLDRSVNWFSVDLLYGGAIVTLSVDSVDDAPSPSQLVSAEAIWKDIHSFDARAKEFASGELLALKNELWLEEEQEVTEVTDKEFRNRMTLKWISISDDEEFSFSYSDGELFWGHAIDITGTVKNGFSDADVSG